MRPKSTKNDLSEFTAQAYGHGVYGRKLCLLPLAYGHAFTVANSSLTINFVLTVSLTLVKILHSFWAKFEIDLIKLKKTLIAQISFFSYLVCFSADQMAGLKFADMHNLAMVLADPLVAHG